MNIFVKKKVHARADPQIICMARFEKKHILLN